MHICCFVFWNTLHSRNVSDQNSGKANVGGIETVPEKGPGPAEFKVNGSNTSVAAASSSRVSTTNTGRKTSSTPMPDFIPDAISKRVTAASNYVKDSARKFRQLSILERFWKPPILRQVWGGEQEADKIEWSHYAHTKHTELTH